MAAPVLHFEIHASNRPDLIQFYESVFGWKSMEVEGMPYTLVYPTGEVTPGESPSIGIGGGMVDREGPRAEVGAPVNGFVCVIEVPDLDVAHAAVLAHGGEEAVPPMDVEGVGRFFYFRDPDNNIAGCLQSEPM